LFDRFPSNLVHSISGKGLTLWLKNYPLHLTHVCTLPCKLWESKLWQNSVL